MGEKLPADFSLENRVAIITGGAGLLGQKHSEAIAAAGGIPVVTDINIEFAEQVATRIKSEFGVDSFAFELDVTDESRILELVREADLRFGRIDILINNAANNPKVEGGENKQWFRLEKFPLSMWMEDLAVGLTGPFLCSKHIGTYMADRRTGVILNIASDLALIAPDQRIYRKENLAEDEQFTKPISYSIAKSGLVGMTKYLASYWGDAGIRVNSISPGGVFVDQDTRFVEKLTSLIPLGRMAKLDEYMAAVVFLVSDASTYMTGANLVIDGGRTAW